MDYGALSQVVLQDLKLQPRQSMQAYGSRRTECFAEFVTEMGGIGKAGGVCRGGKVVATDDLANRMPHPIPATITPERHADLFGKQVLKT
jgi:hypothetical protein